MTYTDNIKNLSITALTDLCAKLRSDIIKITNKNGGHLGSNLGVIELTVAVHYVFDSPIDKIIFDVGHNSYAHKFLTGRERIMENLRSESGASGFQDPNESEHDPFISGHASTSLSAAIGIAAARDLSDDNFHVISIVGDGSMSGGMIYEAMNNIGTLKKFIVILNDNQMSISETVGGMRRYLTRLLSSRRALFFRMATRKFLDRIPRRMSFVLEKIIKSIITLLRGRTIFEDFGFQYIGPIDGHDVNGLVSLLQNIKNLACYKPVLIHVMTKKGNGYEPAVNDTYKLHGVTKKSSGLLYTDIFEKEIVDIARENEKIVCITAAMKSGCGLVEFASLFPTRFFDVGISESHAITFAAGLAISGYKPFVCLYSSFLQRGFDQIYHDVVLQNLPVTFIIDKAGFPGSDGKTHSGIYDIAMLSMFENFQIFTPCSDQDLVDAIKFAAFNNTRNPIAIRFPKSEAYCGEKLSHGSNKILIAAVGNTLRTANDAIHISGIEADIICIHQISPFDFQKFIENSSKYEAILIMEEGIYGGFSSLVLEHISNSKRSDVFGKIHIVNVSKCPVPHCSAEIQALRSRMSPLDIAKILKHLSSNIID